MMVDSGKNKAAIVSELPVVNAKGKAMSKVKLDSFVFDGKVNHAILHQAVVAYLANQRRGLACAKTRGEVSGGGRKPWRQKGTGRARVGSNRSPLWRGGGITFGPKPHSFNKEFPKKMKAHALKSALNAKLRDGELTIIDDLKLASPKTKNFAKILDTFGNKCEKIQLVVIQLDINMKLAGRNIPGLKLQEAKSLTAYEALTCKKLVLVSGALQELEKRLKGRLQ